MRRSLAVSAIAAAVLLSPLPAQADHRPQEYCSESGDVCQSVRRVDGVRKLKIVLAEKYFSRYRLCVKAPDGSRTCKGFRIQEQGEQYGDSVRWRKHFPDAGAGAYSVTWKSGGARVGARLGFHI
jgi:hypothetical protein